ncbi:DNA primase [Lusitaniella coriacea]|uniref:DNA primase n=1 Tax=Lusitaniella coriacea TaxID=1983105 RepID=UPI003CFB102F
MDIPRLHPDTIAEIKERLDIVEIVSEQVVLRKRGKDHLGLCPFHEEKTPSFSVSPSKQIYYCFGCNAGGDAISFLMEAGKISYPEALLNLARRYQVPIKTVEPEKHQELQRQLSLREQLYEVLAVSANFYQHALRQPQGETALKYVREQRQLSEETLQQFGLGYAPAGWETLYRYLVETKGFSITLVEEAGLIRKRKKGEGHYDYFRDRLMIPINDDRGRIVGFGSRTLGNDEPKYLNSPETPLFDKSKVLFALDKAKSAIAKQDRAVVVEGYFDAIALHSQGITNAVAALGTAFNRDRLNQLLRYTESKQVIFNFDADSAGTNATQRAIRDIETLVYGGQVQLRVLNLPDGKDADDFLKSSSEAAQIYRQQVLNAPLWIDWQIDQLLLNRDIKQGDQFEQIVQKMVELLNHLENPAKRTHYIQHCAEKLSQGDNRLTSLYVQNLLSELRKPQKTKTPNSRSNLANFSTTAKYPRVEQAETLLLLIYLHCRNYRPALIEQLEEKDLLFRLPHHRFLWQCILRLQASFDKDLLSKLQDISNQFPEQFDKVNHFLYLTDAIANAISRPKLQIARAIQSLELIDLKEYQRYCYEEWQKAEDEKNEELVRFFNNELIETQQKIDGIKNKISVSHFDVFGTSE